MRINQSTNLRKYERMKNAGKRVASYIHRFENSYIRCLMKSVEEVYSRGYTPSMLELYYTIAKIIALFVYMQVRW
jgi:hypothetical protein